ncbi:hypothetical protein [Mycobacterium asiaticum]
MHRYDWRATEAEVNAIGSGVGSRRFGCC